MLEEIDQVIGTETPPRQIVVGGSICEKIESVDLEALQTYKDWQDRSDEIIELQGEWKKIGFAP